MDPFQVSLNQVNFEEQELTAGDEELHAFSNIFSHDADFTDADGVDGIPVAARKYNPQSKSSFQT